MSRVSLIEQLYVKRKSALEFSYDALWAPPIRSILSQEDINELYRIATSLRYNANIEKKYELIDAIMQRRGFRKAHAGTNRVVYNFLEMPTFVAKVAIDRVGMEDSPAEYKNQEYFKPFCCKIFEVDQTGVIAFVERVNPITSLEEFLSVSDDIFNMMLTKIIGKYVIDDLGTEKFMNYGLRCNANGHTFGPVIIDFPYAYELDGAKLICRKAISSPLGQVPCGGEIDYDVGFNHLVCTKCGRTYSALDLKKNNKNILIMYGDDKKGDIKMRARIVDGNGKVIMDSGISSRTHITKEEFESLPAMPTESRDQVPVSKTKRVRRKPIKEFRKDYYTSLQIQQYNEMQKTIGKSNNKQVSAVNTKSYNTINNLVVTDESKETTCRTVRVIEPPVVEETTQEDVIETVEENEEVNEINSEITSTNDISEEIQPEVVEESTTETEEIIKDKVDNSNIYGSPEDLQQYNQYFGEKERRKNRRKNNKKYRKNKNKGFNDFNDGMDDF